MSFFEEDDEPTRRQPRPRRPAPAAGGLAVDPQTLWARRAVALGVGVLLLVLLVVAANSCRTSARKSSLKDYNREVNAIVQQSDQTVGAPFFEALEAANQDNPEDVQTSISGYRVESEKLLEQAERVSTPDDMAIAQRSLLIALELRRDGLAFIASRITSALGDEGDATDQAIEEIAAQMQSFLASDVLLQARVTPVVKKALEDDEIGGQTIIGTEGFLGRLEWMTPEFVASRLGAQLSEGGSNRSPNEPTGPGKHGTGLVSVSVGDAALQPGVAGRLPAGQRTTFAVKFHNQGDNDEFDVDVIVTLRPDGGGKSIRATKTIDTVVKRAMPIANVALEAPPPKGVYTVEVRVRAVPGEQLTDNNNATYRVQFE